MNERIKQLRKQSLRATNTLSPERALLVTEFYKSHEAYQVSTPVQRALAFKHIMENKQVCISDLELIVGERGPVPKATPTYPEVSLHSLKDLDILNDRLKVSFKVSKETRDIYEKEIIPFWKGKTQRDRLFNNMSEGWIKAYEAGVFTEFQEQRAPGHTVAGKKVFQKGMLDFIREAEEAESHIDFINDPD